MLARVSTARVRHGQFAILADVRAMPIEPGDVIDGVGNLIAKGLKLTSAPIGLVTSSMLGKMQADRVLTAPNCRTFTDMDAAHAWLEEQWPSAKGGQCPPIEVPARAA